MRIFFWFVVVNALLTLARQGLAQDSLLYNTTTPLTLNPSTVIDASTALKWRLSGALGYHRQLQNNPGNESLFLTNGLQATVAADYFIGSNWGLGVQVGYQNLVVDKDAFRRAGVVPSNSILQPPTSLHTFMLTAGPAFSLPIGQRLTLDFDVRGGVFFNDAPVINAFFEGTNKPALTITPNDQRFGFGANGSLGLKYQLTQQLAAGIAGNVSYTSFNYMQISPTSYNQYPVVLNMYGVQATIAYRFLSRSRQPTVAAAPVVAPKPICYPPVLDTSQPTEYEVGNERPVIRWRSSAPVYTEGERYVFRLYTLPGNKLLYERTVQEPQLNWPAQLALPDTASYYFYSIYTSRSDEAEQTCRSEPIVGAFGFFSRQSAPPSIQRVTPREITYAFTLRLYALQPTRVYEKATVITTPTIPVQRSPNTARSGRNRLKATKLPAKPRALSTVRVDSTQLTTVQTDSVRTRLTLADSAKTDSTGTRLTLSDSTKVDSMVTSIKIVPNLIYEEAIQQPNFLWPGNVVLPAQPTVYQYTIVRNSNRELIHSYYLMVEPDGCSQIINEAMKNNYLRNSLSSIKSVPNGVQPTNKGQP